MCVCNKPQEAMCTIGVGTGGIGSNALCGDASMLRQFCEIDSYKGM